MVIIRKAKRSKWPVIILTILLAGIYTGIGTSDVCNGAYLQKSLTVSIVKPFFPGYWTIYLGIGNKHWDYAETEYKYTDRETNLVIKQTYKKGCGWNESKKDFETPEWHFYSHPYEDSYFIDLLYPKYPTYDAQDYFDVNPKEVRQ